MKLSRSLPVMFIIVVVLVTAKDFVSPVKAVGNVDILCHTGYLDFFGNYHVVGEVQNVGDQAVGFVKINATFYNSSDGVIETRFDFSMLNILLVDRKSPFDIALLDITQSAKVDHYNLNVTFSPTSPIPLGLEILSHSSYVDASNRMHVVGEIKNLATEKASNVKVIATYYDEKREVVAATLAYLDPENPNLDPSETRSFEIILDDESRTPFIDTYALTAESLQYAIILESERPFVSVLSPENKTFYPENTIPLTFSVSESTSWIGYSLDGQTNVTITGNTTLTDLLGGSHYVIVYANDTSGNMGASNTVYFSVDTTPPNITNVFQTPPENNVLPEDEIKVNATVTDNLSGVKQVTLNYTNGNGTWFTVDMTNLEENIWNVTIPKFQYCTYVNYTIVAEDNVGNIITTEKVFGYQYQYHVIPEFPSFLILPLFVIATLLAAIAYRRKHLKC